MPSLSKAIRRNLARLSRLRNRNGYGVHSPFAYNFIKGVVYERGEYYAYRELRRMRQRQSGGAAALSAKSDMLMFRLANLCRPRQVWLAGAGAEVTARYVAAGCRGSDIRICGNIESVGDVGGGMLVATSGCGLYAAFGKAAATADSATVFVAAGIHTSKKGRGEWKKICADSRAVVTFDLYETGIVFFNKELNKQNYRVSF